MDSDNAHGGPITAVSGNNGGSKPATPIPPPSPSTTPLPPSSIPPSVPSPSSLVTSHGPPGPPIGRYGYGQPPMPPSSGQGPSSAGSNQLHSASPTFHNSLQNNHAGPMGSHLHHSAGGYPSGGYSGPPPSGPPPPGHHGQYMPMMMPPPSQYPNKPPPPPGMMPQQQPTSQHPHPPQGPPDGRYANYGPPPSRMSGPPPAPSPGPPPPMHHGNVQSQYYSMRHQMPPHQMMNKNYPYPSANVGYGPVGMPPNQNHPAPPMPPSSSASGHMPPHLPQTPTHPMHHHHLHPPPHPHQPHPSQHPHQIPHVYGTPNHNSHGPEFHNSSNNVTTNSLTSSSISTTTSSPMIGNNSSIGMANSSSTGRSTPNNINHHNNNNSSSNGNIRLPQPPLIIDEVSQTSTASSQAADDSCASSDNVQISSHNKGTHNSNPNAKHLLSHPPTPGTSNLGSPGAASLSSYHDDFDSVSSPSWPRTPASPSLNNSQYDSHIHNSKRPDNVQKLYEMSDEPERKIFLDKFFQFLDERGTQLNQVPTISKIPLDLFRLYVSVKERGGYLEVTRQKMWKDCALICKIANSSSASYTLRKQYMKHLLPFECKFDRGGIEMGPLLSSADSTNANRKKSAQNKLSNSGRSTPNTPRLSPNDSPSSYPPHHPAHHSQMHSGYDQADSSQPSTYSSNTNNTSGPNNTTTPPYHHGPPPPSSQSAGSYPQHPEPYSQHNAQYGSTSTPATQHNANSGQNLSQTLQANHESVSVKDPFSDEDVISNPRVSKSNTSSYSSRNQHYSIPNNTVSYGYGPNGPQGTQSQTNSGHPPPPPPPPSSQSQHPNNYPENISQQYPPDPSGYPRSNSTAPPGDSPGGPSNANPPYGSRLGMNSGMQGYFGQFQQQPPPPPPPSQPQQPPQPTGPFEHSSGGHSPSRSYDHHGQHGYSPGHRYPIPNNATGPPPHQSGGHAPGSYPNRLPPPGNNSSYPGQQSGPHSLHHGGPGAQHQASAPPPPSSQQSSYPLPNTPGSQESSGTSYPNKNTDNYNSAIRMQSPLAQRLLAAKLSNSSTPTPTPTPTSTNQQTYTANQQYSNSSQAGTGQSNKPQHSTPQSSVAQSTPPPSSSASSMQANTNISWMSSQSVRYNQPKRHPDFAKQNEPYPPTQSPSTSTYQPQSQSYGSSGQTVPPRSMPPSPGSAPPNAVCPSWNRENHQYRMSSGPGNYYHNNYPNSGQNSGHQQREWHDSRTGPGHPPAPPSNSMDSPMTTAHWSSSRYSNNSGGNYPPNDYSGQSQTTGHFPNTSGSSGHSNSGSKMMPPQMPQYSGIRPEQQGTRSNYIMGGPPSTQPPSSMYSNKLPGGSNSMPNDPYSHYNAPGMGLQYGMHHSAFSRRESIFPPNTVEATVPTPNKRRKLMARDIAPVEAWRIYMSLKSGLLAESTFALDVLNVYSNDDNTLIYLSLPNMPGLLEVLLEHFRRYLNEMFDNVFENIDIENENKRFNQINGNLNNKKNRKLKWYELDSDLMDTESTTKDEIDEDIELFLDKNFQLNGKKQLTLLDSGRNYTNVTRNGKTVKVKKDKNLFIADHKKEWDISVKSSPGSITNHIQSHMEPKEKYLRFCRLIKSAKQKNCDDNDSDMNENNSYEENILINGNTDKMNQKNDTYIESENENEYPKIHPTDRERYWNKIHQPDFEDESYDQEEPAVCTGGEYHDSIKSRCLTVSNLIRNLTFVPGNDLEMCKNSCLLFILSRLLLLHHVHAVKRKRKITEIDCTKISANKLDEETMLNLTEENLKKMTEQKEYPEKEWWWESLHLIRENTMVTLANISGQLDLSIFPESIALTLLDGLLHWAVCPSSYAQDAFPSAPNSLSPRRLAYETLSKLSIYEFNVDLILATPPWSRIEKFLNNLTCSLVRNDDQTTREFSIVLISNFANADPSVVRVLALSSYSVSLLLGFIEQAENNALNTANAHGIQYLRENFDSIGTTPDMVRRAAAILRTLARYNENHSLFIQHEQRLLSLSMSQILDNSISSIIADILYECSFEPSSSSHLISSSSPSMPAATTVSTKNRSKTNNIIH